MAGPGAAGAGATGILGVSSEPSSIQFTTPSESSSSSTPGDSSEDCRWRDKSWKARSPAPGPPPALPTSSPYQNIVFRKSGRQEQNVSAGVCSPQASTRGLGMGVGGQDGAVVPGGWWGACPALYLQVPQFGKCLLAQRGVDGELRLWVLHRSSWEGSVAAVESKVGVQPEIRPTRAPQPQGRDPSTSTIPGPEMPRPLVSPGAGLLLPAP